MATNDPLFVADLATIKERLRFSGVPSNSTDAQAIFDECLLRARLAIYRRLGALRVAHFKAITYTLNPTTEDGILRALCNSLEIDLVRMWLFRLLPSAWMDGSGDLNKRWNEEAPFRERGSSALAAEIQRLEDSVEQSFQLLAGDEDFEDESEVQGFTIEPTTTSPRPGDSLLIPLGTSFIDTPEDP